MTDPTPDAPPPSNPNKGQRLVAVLWGVTALLAWSAVLVRHASEGTWNWGLAAAGLFAFGMALGAWTRSSPAA